MITNNLFTFLDLWENSITAIHLTCHYWKANTKNSFSDHIHLRYLLIFIIKHGVFSIKGALFEYSWLQTPSEIIQKGSVVFEFRMNQSWEAGKDVREEVIDNKLFSYFKRNQICVDIFKIHALANSIIQLVVMEINFYLHIQWQGYGCCSVLAELEQPVIHVIGFVNETNFALVSFQNGLKLTHDVGEEEHT